MNLHKVLKKDVPNIINDTDFWQRKSWPITPHRLNSLYHNFESDKDDIVLYYYTNEVNEVKAYLSIYYFNMPYMDSNYKMGVASAWYNDEDAKGLGYLLMRQANEDLECNLMTHMFDIKVEPIYKAMGFFNVLREMQGTQYIFKNSKISKLLPQKKENKLLEDLKLNDIKLEYVSFLDNTTFEFVQQASENDLFPKPQAFFEYLFHYPWVLKAPVSTLVEKNRFHFSNTKEEFNIYFIKMLKKEKLASVIVISHTGKKMKVLFNYYLENSVLKDIAAIILLHAIKLGIKEIFCFEDELNNELKKIKIYNSTNPVRKLSMISDKFDVSKFGNGKLNYGDGDVCFT